MGKSTTHAIEHEALAVVLQVRRDELQVLLWERARAPFEGDWALPGGLLGPRATLEAFIQRQLAARVDVTALSPPGARATMGESRNLPPLHNLEPVGAPGRHLERRVIAPAYPALVPAGIDPKVPA